jgi:hypothetical protein
MRRLGALCLLLGLSAPAFADDKPPAEEQSIPWYRWLFLGERAKPAPKPDPAAAKDKAPATSASANIPSRDSVAKMWADEQNVYMERLKAITKIRTLANEQGDEELLKKADDLEAQAEELYKLRTAKLPVPAAKDDRASLERNKDDRPATAQRPTSRRPSLGGNQ